MLHSHVARHARLHVPSLLTTLPPSPQAWDNFKGELQALRRSVRYDEYSQILEKRTDQGLITKVGWWGCWWRGWRQG